ncbi:hypothetical protein HNR68_000017 [Saccharopolyspora hordei]|uniref:Uncharacterized protein n=1 Tax=Saccharopolyspora hordei TaxID=1838 RepID=A0A853AN19_9PSEU|nr:hypothetical protein [Saccharopolyspora hordei]
MNDTSPGTAESTTGVDPEVVVVGEKVVVTMAAGPLGR